MAAAGDGTGVTVGGLRLRPLRVDDEAAFLAAQDEMAGDDFRFGLEYDDGMDWRDYMARLAAHRRGEALAPDWVPHTFMVADVSGVIVGRTSIRHELNDFLRSHGGHIGYGVLRAHRRRGYATAIMRQSLVSSARSVLIGCW